MQVSGRFFYLPIKPNATFCERVPVPGFTSYKLLEACREPGCPICRLEQQGVERYLDNQFYENVNNPAWRDHLRASHGFCHEHSWLGVNKRLGDALGFSIIYHDIVNNLLRSLKDDARSTSAARRRASVDGQAPESLAPLKRCPAADAGAAGFGWTVPAALAFGSGICER